MKNERVIDMKTNIKVIGYGLWVMVALLVSAPTMAQVEQQPNDNQFRSTSTMVGSGSSYSANPTINAGGTANAPSFGGGAPSGPRYAPKPISDDEYWEEHKEELGTGISTPVGDAVLPLALMAMAFAGVIYFRRKRSALKR